MGAVEFESPKTTQHPHGGRHVENDLERLLPSPLVDGVGATNPIPGLRPPACGRGPRRHGLLQRERGSRMAMSGARRREVLQGLWVQAVMCHLRCFLVGNDTDQAQGMDALRAAGSVGVLKFSLEVPAWPILSQKRSLKGTLTFSVSSANTELSGLAVLTKLSGGPHASPTNLAMYTQPPLRAYFALQGPGVGSVQGAHSVLPGKGRQYTTREQMHCA